MVVLYILPNHLYDEINNTFIERHNVSTIKLWEHPDFFTKYNFNKKKLVLHRASMKYYYTNTLKKLEDVKLKYIKYNEKHELSENDRYIFFDPINKIKEFIQSTNHVMLESPNFLLTKEDYKSIAGDEEDNKKRGRIRFTSDFYKFCKKKIDYLQKTPNQDKFNRAHKTNKSFNSFTPTNTKSHNSHHPLSPVIAGVKSRTCIKLTQP